MNSSQKEKAEQFRALHHSGKMLILPNTWDVLGALLMEDLEYPAVATASAAIAYANGYDDGEQIPFTDLLTLLKKICAAVDLPVTADIENGYADTDDQLQEKIRALIGSGITGINIEDTDAKTHQLHSAENQCRRIRLIRKLAGKMDIPLFINARTDIYLHEAIFPAPAARLEEIIKRGLAYRDAGADGFFPILLRKEEEIKKIIAAVNLPLNILTLPGIPELKTLSGLGVARISLGPSLLKIAIRSMRQVAMQLKDQEGLTAITENEISSDYLKKLVSKEN